MFFDGDKIAFKISTKNLKLTQLAIQNSSRIASEKV